MKFQLKNKSLCQDYDPFAWDVNNQVLGSQSDGQNWESQTGEKISYWSNTCIADGDRALTRTRPFQQACHDNIVIWLTRE